MSKRILEKTTTEKAERKRYGKRSRTDQRLVVDSKKYTKITTKGHKIMPPLRKYAGCIHQSKGRTTWTCGFNLLEFKKKKSFATREAAEEYRLETNVKECIAKNIIYLYKEQYYCALTQKQLMKFSIEDREMVDSLVWCAHFSDKTNSYYAKTTDPSSKVGSTYFHQSLFPQRGKDETIDHFNMDSLDNNRENLRIANRTTQLINQRVRSTNKTGIKGVYHDEARGCWKAYWSNDQNEECQKSFSVKKYGQDAKNRAILERENAVANTNKYKIALSL